MKGQLVTSMGSLSIVIAVALLAPASAAISAVFSGVAINVAPCAAASRISADAAAIFSAASSEVQS